MKHPELIRKVLDSADLSIDTRRELGLPPRKIDPAPGRLLWQRLTMHDGLFYCTLTKTLHVYMPCSYYTRRPVDLDYHDDGLFIFNNMEREHLVEIVFRDGSFYGYTSSTAWATERRVMFV